MWKVIIYCGKGWFQDSIFFSHIAQVVFSILGLNRGGSVDILMYHMYLSISAILCIERSPTSRNLGVENLQPPLDISRVLFIFFYCSSSPSSIHASGRTCHRCIQISNSSCSLHDQGSLVSHCSQHLGRHYSSVSHWKRLDGQRFATAAFNLLAAHRCVAQTRVLFLSLSCSGRVIQASIIKL